ncbi:hypothetical protein N7493_005804 [Penicillium malachiteum]|uniref:Uncharacterized protein n=1 Tax=Penicillium malachiteum TaxID=1324776 RepID=A0AAD6MVY3_9EURO|nr:hypothetical protein N7493_005804 [Penicillium malachiteum]
MANNVLAAMIMAAIASAVFCHLWTLRRNPSDEFTEERRSLSSFAFTQSSASTEADEPSETSKDCAFVVSDGEPSSGASSASSLLFTDYLPSVEQKGVFVNKPIGSIAKRLVNENGHLVEQYLVLWCSWEKRMPADTSLQPG